MSMDTLSKGDVQMTSNTFGVFESHGETQIDKAINQWQTENTDRASKWQGREGLEFSRIAGGNAK